MSQFLKSLLQKEMSYWQVKISFYLTKTEMRRLWQQKVEAPAAKVVSKAWGRKLQGQVPSMTVSQKSTMQAFFSLEKDVWLVVNHRLKRSDLHVEGIHGILRYSKRNIAGNGLKGPAVLVSFHMTFAEELHPHSENLSHPFSLMSLASYSPTMLQWAQLYLPVTSNRHQGLLLPLHSNPFPTLNKSHQSHSQPPPWPWWPWSSWLASSWDGQNWVLTKGTEGRKLPWICWLPCSYLQLQSRREGGAEGRKKRSRI